MIAILSDIHGNLEALEAVLVDADRFAPDRWICLGDVVGYGPDPVECLLHAMNFSVVLKGNHEQALHLSLLESLEKAVPFWPPTLANSISKTMQLIRSSQHFSKIEAFLAAQPRFFRFQESLFVHGSPRDYTNNEYVFPEDVYATDKMKAIFAKFDSLCFCGHTHVPGIFTANQGWKFSSPPESDFQHRLDDDYKVLCNVGSVGQPRDDDPRACYVLFDGSTIVFRRVEYDVEVTRQKIHDSDDDDMFGDRLLVGR